MLNKIVENPVSKVENFTFFDSNIAEYAENSVFINVLDRVFHIGKKKPLQQNFCCKGFLFTFYPQFLSVGLLLLFSLSFVSAV